MVERTVPAEFADLARVQASEEDALFAKPNVVGVALGNKYTAGRDTGERAITALVETKLADDVLAEDERLPRTVRKAPVDVQEVGILQAGTPPNPPGDDSARRFRPAFGGLSVGHYRITAGTLATCCYDAEFLPGKPPRYYLLSNNHVLANSNDAAIGDPILQPGPADGGAAPADVIARLSRFVPIKFAQQGQQAPRNVADAAIAEGRFADLDRRIYWVGHLRGTNNSPRPDEQVHKCGRTTNYSTGRIRNVNATVNVNYGGGRVARFARQILTSNMSEGGDSGSLVAGLDDRAVGLLFAGSAKVTIANPIGEVQQLLGIRVTES